MSETARFEVNDAAHPVESPVAGLVTTTALALGREVREGEVLAELDAEPLRLELAESRAKLADELAQLAAIKRELAAEERSADADGSAAKVAVAAARARFNEAKVEAQYDAREAQVLGELQKNGLASGLDAARADASARTRVAAADALKYEAAATRFSRQAQLRDRLTRIARVGRDLAGAEGTAATLRAGIARLEHEVARRRIVAPVAGRLADVAWLPAGAHVAEGQRLAVIVPTGATRVVAQFLPANALGRVRAGQRARLRVDGFPWAQFGTVAAAVREVGSEPHDGFVRVELTPDANARIPVQHGMTAAVEVEIDRVAPLMLLLREIGQAYAGPVRAAGDAGPGQKPTATEAPRRDL